MSQSFEERFLKTFKHQLPIILVALGIILFLLISSSAPFTEGLLAQLFPKQPSHAAGKIYYVSKNGNNIDGSSWTNAWNELSNINWSIIQPGDTIEIDGGSSSMTYTTSLVIGTSGTPSAPITIQLSPDTGHNGQVIIFGGRTYQGQPFPLPECDYYTATNPPPAYTTPLNVGVDFAANNVSYVTVDGTKWGGMKIFGFKQNGVKFGGSSNNTAKNMEIYDNGDIYLNIPSSTYRTRLPGVYPGGSNNTIYQLNVHDNGEDSLQTGQAFTNFSIIRSWLHNSRSSVVYGANIPFNYCAHSDGFQVYGGGTSTGVTIDSSILGPGHMQGTILGQATNNNGSITIDATVNNVTIKNSLFIDDFNSDVLGYAYTAPQNWTLDHDTLYMDSNNYINPIWGNSHTIYLEGAGHSVTNSIAYGGNLVLPSGTQYSNNCEYGITGGPSIGTVANPQFTNPPNNTSLQNSESADFTVNNPTCVGKGSTITSVVQLMGSQPTPAPSVTTNPTPSPTATATITTTSSPKPTNTPTPSPTSTASSIPSGCIASNGTWQNSAFPSQTGSFTITFDATPANNLINSVMGVSDNATGAYTDLAAIVRFNPSGDIDAINGGIYQANSTIPYSANQTYHFRLIIDTTNHLYSAYVTPQNSSEILIGSNLNFRTEQATVSTLNNIGSFTLSPNTNTVCTINATPISTSAPSNTPSASPTQSIPGDINGDNVVNIFDISIMLRYWGTSNSAADINKDGKVNIFDLSILLSHWTP